MLEDKGVMPIWNGEPIVVGEHARYTCLDNEKLFFEVDRNKTSFPVVCTDDGTFNTSHEDLLCVSSNIDGSV